MTRLDLQHLAQFLGSWFGVSIVCWLFVVTVIKGLDWWETRRQRQMRAQWSRDEDARQYFNAVASIRAHVRIQ